MRSKIIAILSLLLLAGSVTSDAYAAPSRKAVKRRADIVGGPQGAYPYAVRGLSKKNILDIPSHHPYSILHAARHTTDTLHIICVRVEFKLDSSELTTGNGHFGIGEESTPTAGDREESGYYPNNNGAAYTYDDLPHGKEYFEDQLRFVQNYFRTVSRGKFQVDFTVLPSTAGYGDPPEVPGQMTSYSPGAKKPKESWDDYYYRRTVGLMEFVRDAVQAADGHPGKPFSSVRQDPATGILYVTVTDNKGVAHEKRAAVLLIHAGASYWTDGGTAGYFGQDTPSDMIDAFISPEFFDYFKDTLEFDTLRMGSSNDLHRGVLLNNANGTVLLDEIMMVSETSNQDSLNWGIHGIMVNQIARQIGIPDLHSNQSEVGSFCIMDIAGYSAGRGFIPPWPSAWVRAFMGWETPVVAGIGPSSSTYYLRAVGDTSAGPGDTTILLVPINDHEYYLLENRQRNLSSTDTVFNYDTLDQQVYIDPYDHVNLKANARPVGSSDVLDSVRNYDISIPASGVVVWHIDENLVKDRLEYNVLNSDSLYGAVSLVEADGIDDLGILFMDIFYQAAFDYGGAEDVFPHTTIDKPGGDATVVSFGPFTRPSTQSNDGGHTYLTISFAKTGRRAPAAPAREIAAIRDYYVANTPDSVFAVTISRDPLVPGIDGWPKQSLPSRFFEPVLCNAYGSADTMELAALDTAGRLYVWPAEGPGHTSFGSERDSVIVFTFQGDSARWFTINTTDTGSDTIISSGYAYTPVTYLRKIPQPVSHPTAVNGILFIPSGASKLYVLDSITVPDSSAAASWDSVALPAPASSYVCNYSGTKWAVGCSDGSVVFGSSTTVAATVAPGTGRKSPVDAIAVLDSSAGEVAVIHRNGILAVCSPSAPAATAQVQLGGGIGPYTLATADLNRLDTDNAADIVVCDRKQGVWLFKSGDSLRVSPQWRNEPNDWPGVYHYTEEGADTEDRTLLPDNGSAPSIADINGDGALDIVAGGTNGIYVMNYKGVFITDWPSYLDNRYWYQRGSVVSTPAVGLSADGSEPRVVFSSPTGQHVTFAVARIDSASEGTGKIFYTYNNGMTDSIGGLSESLIDTLLVFGDSIILPYITPGGYIDALDPHGKRPDTTRVFSHTGTVRQSYWPLSTGGNVSTSPILCDMDNDGLLDIVAVSNSGSAYRFELSAQILSDSLIWPQAGFDNSRVYTYRGPPPGVSSTLRSDIEFFYNYPNPVEGLDETVFRYKFGAAATDVRLDVFTYTGYHVYSAKQLPTSYPDSDEHVVDMRTFGPGVYRCRLQATVGGVKKVKYWKMAVVR